MSCDVIRFLGGTAIVCGPRKRPPKCWVSHCQKPGERLCDFRPIRGGPTCDHPICVDHAKRVADDVDYCPQCAQEATR